MISEIELFYNCRAKSILILMGHIFNDFTQRLTNEVASDLTSAYRGGYFFE
jgi:hypothetical protein